MRLKYLKSLRETESRPGLIAATNQISTILLNYSDFLSYHPPSLNHCRRSSKGGYAPYLSLLGMFMSSTKMIIFVPIIGPYTPFLRYYLSNLLSSTSQTYEAVLLAEKAVIVDMKDSGNSFNIRSLVIAVLPVPVFPMNRHARSLTIRV